ncbi:hypothetical protein DPMN_074226 [Dreissena polymorpha]|uniref:Uncharacterized protein n=1 Tax=Dreissena polymorpha TaxID=45954 RepID=A0A9D4BDV8_DREPO|nr:hypothetical protein DPMN_074226 [Dreissena polymorpha]
MPDEGKADAGRRRQVSGVSAEQNPVNQEAYQDNQSDRRYGKSFQHSYALSKRWHQTVSKNKAGPRQQNSMGINKQKIQGMGPRHTHNKNFHTGSFRKYSVCPVIQELDQISRKSYQTVYT